MHLIFLCPSLYICTQPSRECVLKQRFKPTPQRYSSVSKKISLRENTLVSVAAGFCVLSCVTKISVSSLGLGWDLIFVFRC